MIKKNLKSKLKIWHISDTHGYHKKLKIPEGIDIIIHSGDAGNYGDPYRSEPEIREFANWFATLPIEYKIYVAGNHDSSVEHLLWNKQLFDKLNIDYLFNSTINIMGIQIWGSPFTPRFGNWSFMKDRSKINKVWESIPEDTDIIITHGPPKYILDLTINRDHSLESCGDSALGKKIIKLNPKLVCFGHIHNTEDVRNAGILKLTGEDIIYSNGSCVTDRKFGKLLSYGNLFEIDLITKKIIIL